MPRRVSDFHPDTRVNRDRRGWTVESPSHDRHRRILVAMATGTGKTFTLV